MGAHDRIPADPANYRHRCTAMYAGGAFRNSPLQPDQEKPASGKSPSSQKRNPRSTTIIRQNGRPPRRRPPIDLNDGRPHQRGWRAPWKNMRISSSHPMLEQRQAS
jgi:hypothetical protein